VHAQKACHPFSSSFSAQNNAILIERSHFRASSVSCVPMGANCSHRICAQLSSGPHIPLPGIQCVPPAHKMNQNRTSEDVIRSAVAAFDLVVDVWLGIRAPAGIILTAWDRSREEVHPIATNVHPAPHRSNCSYHLVENGQARAHDVR
jgi:hypothetical protein